VLQNSGLFLLYYPYRYFTVFNQSRCLLFLRCVDCLLTYRISDIDIDITLDFWIVANMLRYDGSPMNTNTSYDFGLDQRDDEQSPLGKSFASIASGGSALHTTASSSKAVLAALRALQDKIRRLEMERTQALDDAAQLRNQLKNQDIEAEHAKERDALQAQKSLHDARLAYEKVLREKEEMESSIALLEKRNIEAEHKLEDLQHQVQVLEGTKSETMSRLQEVESQIIHYETQLQNAQHRETGNI
jgi:hypothetical protein